jgi:hypothetical protein
MCALRLLRLFTPLHRRSARVITLSTSPISKLRAADDERRQAKRNSLADKLTVEAKALADLKIEKAAVEGERRTVEADVGPVRYLATLLGADNEAVLRWFILVFALLLDPAAVALGSDADTVLSAKSQDGVQGVRRAREARRVPETGRPAGKRMGEAP